VSGGRLLLLTDFDGTLAPLAADPTQVELAPSTREDLRAAGPVLPTSASGCSRAGPSAMSVPAWPARADLRRLPRPRGRGRGIAFRHPEAERQRARAWADLAGELRARVGSLPGASVEDKGSRSGSTIGTRRPTRRSASSWRRARARGDARPQESLRGKKVIEILPAVDWTKGECAGWIRQAVFGAAADVTTLYLGDDETDELAFGVAGAVGGHGRSGRTRRPRGRRHRLPDVAEVARLFAGWPGRRGAPREVFMRLLGGIWVATLVIMVGFTLFPVGASSSSSRTSWRAAPPSSAKGSRRRSSRSWPAARRPASSACSRSSVDRTGDSRSTTNSRPDRRHADIAANSPVSLPEVTEAITKAVVRQGFRLIDGQKTYVYATPFDREAAAGRLRSRCSSTPPR